MARIIGSPSRYIQGKGTLAELTKYTAKLGKKMLVLISKSGKGRVEYDEREERHPFQC